MRVLIAEDDIHVRKLLRELLEDLAFTVQECGDGESAVAVCLASPPDLVLMDIRLPRLDVIEATRRICAANNQLPVLIVTQFAEPSYRERARKAGAAGYYLKDDLVALQRHLQTLRHEHRRN